LLGAVGTQCLLDRSLRLRALLPLDRATTSSICNTATDFLIVSAIATIEPQAVLDAAVPFVVCCAVGVAWVLLAFVAFAKRLLPDYWVERGVTEFGLSLGATATALLLLRMMDPENGTFANAIVCRKSSRVFAGSANLRSAWRRDAGAARLLLQAAGGRAGGGRRLLLLLLSAHRAPLGAVGPGCCWRGGGAMLVRAAAGAAEPEPGASEGAGGSRGPGRSPLAGVACGAPRLLMNASPKSNIN
jgi:hypothetical protein